MIKLLRFAYTLVAALTLGMTVNSYAADPAYFTKYENMQMSRDSLGVLVVEMTTKGGPLTFTAKVHEQFVDTSAATVGTRS